MNWVRTKGEHAFVLANPVAAPNLSIQVDDGAIVYLNGTEVFRQSVGHFWF